MKLYSPYDFELETFPKDRLKQLLLWFSSGKSVVETESDTLNAILKEVYDIDAEACYEVLDSLDLNELVKAVLMNEFGPKFEQKICFNTLAQEITARLQRKAV